MATAGGWLSELKVAWLEIGWRWRMVMCWGGRDGKLGDGGRPFDLRVLMVT